MSHPFNSRGVVIVFQIEFVSSFVLRFYSNFSWWLTKTQGLSVFFIMALEPRHCTKRQFYNFYHTFISSLGQLFYLHLIESTKIHIDSGRETVYSQAVRSVAQAGSAPRWGCGGRGFKSRRSDHLSLYDLSSLGIKFMMR